MTSIYKTQNYEITLILHPKSKEKDLSSFLSNVFEKASFFLKSLGTKRLSYKIKGVKEAFYYVVDATCNAEVIKDFQRRASFNKNIVRFIVINIDKDTNMSRDFQVNFKARRIAGILRKEEEHQLTKQAEDDELMLNIGTETKNVSKKEVNVQEKIKDSGEKFFEIGKKNSSIRFSEVFEEQLEIQGAKFENPDKDEDFDVKSLFVSMGFKEEDIPKNIMEKLKILKEKKIKQNINFIQNQSNEVRNN